MTELAIDLQHVAKIYAGTVHALQGISMQVKRGEIFGLLGPNGAGKSTLVKIMMTVVRPTRADGTVLGNPVGHKPTLARVGYLPEHHRFPRYLTGRQTIEFFAAMRNVNRSTARRRSTELLEAVGMTAWESKTISTYSKGMMQRIGIAVAMANDPDLIILDEPTDGVDPIGRREIRDLLFNLRARGTSILLNSHLLSELEMICDRVAIMVRGKVVKQGTIDQLTDQKRYEIELALPNPAAVRPQLLQLLARCGAVMKEKAAAGTDAAGQFAVDDGQLPGGISIELSGPMIRLGTTDVAVIQPFIKTFCAANAPIRQVAPVRQTLEELFMQAVTNSESDESATPPGTGQAAPRSVVGGTQR